MNIKKEILTIPNLITTSRIFIIIIAGYLLLNNDIINSFLLYLIAIITDFLDGFLARALKQVTNLGKILDPIADKLMTTSAIIILIYKDLMPIWYGYIILLGALINIIGGIILIKRYKYVPSAILIGKIAAVSVMVTFLLNIVAFLHPNFLLALYILSATLLVISICVYAYKSYKVIK